MENNEQSAEIFIEDFVKRHNKPNWCRSSHFTRLALVEYASTIKPSPEKVPEVTDEEKTNEIIGDIFNNHSNCYVEDYGGNPHPAMDKEMFIDVVRDNFLPGKITNMNHSQKSTNELAREFFEKQGIGNGVER
jgi:hypothetical protein